jgi:intracellular multiplication protein IcmL
MTNTENNQEQPAEEAVQAGADKPKRGFLPAKKAKPAPVKTPDATEEALAKMPAGPLVTVVTRNEFYRDGFRNMIRIAIIQGAIILGLILTIVLHIQASKPVDRYFATTADGRIMNLVPLDQESMTPAALMSWISQAVQETMTFGYHDYQRRLQQASRHFTRRGWESFTTALQKGRVIDTITQTEQVVTAMPRSAPILKQSGVFNGRYRWIVELPLSVTYQAGANKRTDYFSVTLVIERVPSLESPNGVGIEQWVAVQG